MSRPFRTSRAVVALLLAFIPGVLVVDAAAAAGASLTIVPIEWNVVGLDSNSPATGPHMFSVGAQVCNTGGAAVPDASTTWVWDTPSAAISLSGAAAKAAVPLAAGACKKFWYAVDVAAIASSFDKTRQFHIVASGTGAASVLTPTPREIYVEHLVSQNRNSITSVSGPTSVVVGSSYTYSVSGKTAPGGYGQLVASPFFDPSIFEISSVSETLSVGGPSTTFYTDACGWVNDPASASYRSCTTAANAGGTFTTTVTATVVGAGTTTVRSVVYDFSGSSYHYNADFSDAINAITVTATDPPPPPPPVNQPPVAVDDTLTVAQDSAGGSVTVLSNDSDPDADVLSVTSVTQGTNGSVTINLDGTVSYLPDPGFSGSDTFTYTIDDGNGGTDTATVTLTVTPTPPPPPPPPPVNQPPVAVDDTLTVAQDSAGGSVTVLSNDSDPDADVLSVSAVTQGTNGSVTINLDGTVSYLPDPGFSGSDTFTYTIDDGNGGTDTATVTLTVTPTPPPPPPPPPVNQPPVAVDDPLTVAQDSAGGSVTVLSNDSDPDADVLSVTSVTQGTNGSVTINLDGTVSYLPDPGFSGSDTFTYTIDDGNGGTDTATVTLTVTPTPPPPPPPPPVNQPPVAVDDPLTVAQDSAGGSVTVLSNDSDPDADVLSVTSVTQGTNGSVTINLDGTVSYLPDPGFSGSDTFTYTIDDGNGGTDTATVTLTVTPTPPPPPPPPPVNQPPVAVDDTLTVAQDSAGGSVTVLSNDSDPDADVLSVSAVTQGTNGSVTINLDGTVSYLPDPGFSGSDTFTYTIDDGNGGTDTATVTLTVTPTPPPPPPVNQPPVAVDDTLTVAQDGAGASVVVLGNDSDPDADLLTVTAVTQGANGSVTINLDGSVSYLPDAGFSGTDSFTYAVCDPGGACTTATVTVTVTSTGGGGTTPLPTQPGPQRHLSRVSHLALAHTGATGVDGLVGTGALLLLAGLGISLATRRNETSYR